MYDSTFTSEASSNHKQSKAVESGVVEAEELFLATPNSQRQEQESWQQRQRAFSTGNILVVDDNPSNLHLLNKMLSQQGYKVRPAVNGKMALKSLQVTVPDLILLDIMMPEMDGYEVCKQLKSNEQFKNIPIIFISALQEAWDKVKAFSLGAVDYITKPFQLEEVLARIENQLRIQRLSVQLLEQNALLAQEIEERKIAQEQEKIYHKLFENSIDGIVLVDLEGRFINCNASYQKMLGYSLEELKSLTFWDITPNKWHKLEAQIVEQQTIQQGYSPAYEKEYIRKDGTIFPVELTTYCYNNNSEHPEFMWAVVRDISERKKAEAALEKSQIILRSLIDSTSDVVYIKDLQGRYVVANSTVAKWLCKPLDEIIGQDDTALFEPEIARQCIEADQKIIATGIALTYEELVPEQGIMRALLTTKCPWRDAAGNILGIVGISRDITQRKQAEEALQLSESGEREKAKELEQTLTKLQRTQAQLIHAEKMSSLGQMVAGIAHEINNPVTFIFGNVSPAKQYAQELLHLVERYQHYYPQPVAEIAELLEQLEPDFIAEDFPKLLTSMQEGAERIHQIVLSLRNFSRLDEKECKRVDIHSGIDNSLVILQHRLNAIGGETGIQVIKEYGQLPLVTCYVSQLNQVFMNILVNAIDALETQPSPRTITIRTELRQERELENREVERIQGKSPPTSYCSLPTPHVVIHITDNGPGMSENVQKKIFDPFFTTKPVGRGTGLGLSICYQIVVEKHQGQIRCVSALGQGTEFIIELPVEKSNGDFS